MKLSLALLFAIILSAIDSSYCRSDDGMETILRQIDDIQQNNSRIIDAIKSKKNLQILLYQLKQVGQSEKPIFDVLEESTSISSKKK